MKHGACYARLRTANQMKTHSLGDLKKRFQIVSKKIYHEKWYPGETLENNWKKARSIKCDWTATENEREGTSSSYRLSASETIVVSAYSMENELKDNPVAPRIALKPEKSSAATNSRRLEAFSKCFHNPSQFHLLKMGNSTAQNVCRFCHTSFSFLGFCISHGRLSLPPKKTKRTLLVSTILADAAVVQKTILYGTNIHSTTNLTSSARKKGQQVSTRREEIVAEDNYVCRS